MPLVKKHLEIFPWVSVGYLLCAHPVFWALGMEKETQETTFPAFVELTMSTSRADRMSGQKSSVGRNSMGLGA